MPSETFEYYVEEAKKVKTIRQETLDEVLNLIVDTKNNCSNNNLISEGYNLAKKDLIIGVVRLLNK